MFPAPFKSQMQVLLGAAYQAFEKAYETKAPVSIRVNPRKTFKQVNHENIPWTSQGFYLQERPVFTLDPSFHGGAYYVQEASSMFLEQAFVQHTNLSDSLNVLDLCAAPGGKSTHILSLLNDQSLLVSNEVIKSRAYILKENLQKWGSNNVVITNSDPERFSPLKSLFEVIVVDAPCSGEGLFRRDEEAMKEWSPENVQLCVGRQQRILEAIWPALKPGGILIYSTCTFNTKEDEENLDWLLKEYEAETLPLTLNQDWGITEVRSAEKGGIGYKFFPHKVKGEGFFMSVIRKTGGEEHSFNYKKLKNPFTKVSKELLAETENWLQNSSLKKVLFGEQILAFPEDKHDDIVYLTNHLHIVCCGLELGEVKKKNVVPSPALALSLALNKNNFPVLELHYKDALRFLAKENFEIELPEGDWILISYQSIPLGWIKKINNRFNNYYPVEWRIRMNVANIETQTNII
jgi:16S rRNA C967 or C1407 C5-methylase (RsmB/RsmF family)/NOL1/NOP2/fmu family ribosome biogenesis protein